jgi:hypothetical protein
MGTKEVLNSQCGTSCWQDEATCRNYVRKGRIFQQSTDLVAPNANTTYFSCLNNDRGTVLDIWCLVGSGGVDPSTIPSNWTFLSHKLSIYMMNAVGRYVFHLDISIGIWGAESKRSTIEKEALSPTGPLRLLRRRRALKSVQLAKRGFWLSRGYTVINVL